MEEKILELLTALQTAIVTIAPEAWKIIVRQHFISGMVWIIVGIIFLVIIAVMLVYLYKIDKDNGEDIKGEKGAMLVIYTIFFMIIILLEVPSIKEILNPAYYAMMDLVNIVK